ncbi:MAG TPA: zinc ABC transporter substrate-binding protein [Thermococcus sp.]|nr:zinc ABC transporter substrate-binding protein [Thermococcus sp.]
MKVKIFFGMILVALVLISPNVVLASSDDGKPLVVVSTTVLESIVKDLAGDQVDILVLVSPSVCPGHYDVRPSDVWAVSNAKLILYHGIEPWVEKLVEASNSKADVVKVSGPWNTPDALKERYQDVAKILEEKLGISVQERLSEKLKEINEVSEELKAKAEAYNFNDVNVIVMKWQKPFVEWLGFNVVASYPPPEKLSTKDIVELEKKAREENVLLVIDNLQSGVSFGQNLASHVGAVHVTLTNFPGNAPNVNTVLDVMRYNTENLIIAVKTAKEIQEKNALKEKLSTYKTLAIVGISLVIIEALVIIFIRRR